jgi:hypothetical protein
MASGPPEHHVDRLGHRLADRSGNFVLAAEKRLGDGLTYRQLAYIRGDGNGGAFGVRLWEP